MADTDTTHSRETPFTPDFNLWRTTIHEGRSGSPMSKTAIMSRKKQANAFTAWVNDPAVWNGTDRPALDSKVGKAIQNALMLGSDIIIDPWRGAFTSWAMTSPKFDALVQRAQANPKDFRYYQFVGQMFDEMGHDLAHGDPRVEGNEKQTSNLFNHEDPGLVQYRTLLADGKTWQELTAKEVAQRMRNPNGPHVAFGANHAFLETLNEPLDLLPIATSFRPLFEGALAKDGAPKLATIDQPGLSNKDTILICATHTRENKFLNLGQLFLRVDEISQAHSDPRKDSFRHSSPVALQTVATLLQAMVREDEIDRIAPARDEAGRPHFFDPSHPIHIDAKSIETLRRTLYYGYSKGGNDFRDAMRILVHTLDGPGIALEDGLTKRDIMNSITMTLTGLNEEPMDNYYTDSGVVAHFYSNKHDTIAPVPAIARNANDRVRNVMGPDSNNGHTPAYAVQGVLANPRSRDEQRIWLAATQGKAALYDILPVADGQGNFHRDRLTLELPPGTSDAMMEASWPALQAALGKQGITGTKLVRGEGHGMQRYQIVREGGELLSGDSLRQMTTALRSFRGGEAPMLVGEQVTLRRLPFMEKALKAVKQGEPLNFPDLDAQADRRSSVNIKDHPRITRNVVRHPRMGNGEGEVGQGRA